MVPKDDAEHSQWSSKYGEVEIVLSNFVDDGAIVVLREGASVGPIDPATKSESLVSAYLREEWRAKEAGMRLVFRQDSSG
jgi:hypothetical protein